MTHIRTLVTLVMFSSLLLSVVGKEKGLVRSESDVTMVKENQDLNDPCFDIIQNTDQRCPEQSCLNNEITWTNGDNGIHNNNNVRMIRNGLITTMMVLMILW